MHSVHKLLFNQDGPATPKLTLPPLVIDTEPVIKSMSWLSWRSSTPPAFLEPQPQTTMDQQRDVIQLPRSHRLSLSSLSSISSESSSEDDQSWTHMDAKMVEADEQGGKLSNKPSLPSINATLTGINSNNNNNNNNELSTSPSQSQSLIPPSDSSIPAYVTHVDSADDQHRRRHARIDSLSPPLSHHQPSSSSPMDTQSPPSCSSSSASSSDSSSPTSPVPSSLSTFWASPSSIHNEQRHDFVTKNAHIKRPRNAWIHFRCYFGQALKASDPTIRAEEISKRASEYWSRLTNKQKKPWHVMAEQEKLAHQEAFPDYRYRPKRALPKSVVLTYPSSSTCKLDPCSSSKKFRLA